MNKTQIRSNQDDDEDEVYIKNQHLPFFERQQVYSEVKVFLDENIKEPVYYRQILQRIDCLDEGDSLHIVVDTFGGRLDSAIAIIQAMRNTQANVVCEVRGTAASAGSLIALAAPNVFIHPYATMMIHHAVFGSAGVSSNVVSHASFTDKQVRKIMTEVYADFLTDKELEQVFNGAEMWFDSEEIIKRLEQRSAKQQKKVKKQPRQNITT